MSWWVISFATAVLLPDYYEEADLRQRLIHSFRDVAMLQSTRMSCCVKGKHLLFIRMPCVV